MFAGLVTLLILTTTTGAYAREYKDSVKLDIGYAPEAAYKAYDTTENLWKGESNEVDINSHFRTLNRRRSYTDLSAAGSQVNVHACFADEIVQYTDHHTADEFQS